MSDPLGFARAVYTLGDYALTQNLDATQNGLFRRVKGASLCNRLIASTITDSSPSNVYTAQHERIGVPLFTRSFIATESGDTEGESPIRFQQVLHNVWRT